MRNVFLFMTLLLGINSFAWTTPVTVSPASGSTIEGGYKFNWNAVTASEKYQIQIDTTADFSSSAMQTATKTYISSSSSNPDTEHFFDDLYFGITYYWRVRAWIPGDTSAWSTLKTVHVKELVDFWWPAPSEAVVCSPTLNWQAFAGVDFYQLQVDTSLTFSSPFLVTITEDYLGDNDDWSDTEEMFEDLFFGTTYFWRLRVINAVDTSLWNTRSFSIIDEVDLVSPADGGNTWASFDLDWDAYPNIDFYELQLDTSASFASTELQEVLKAYINSSDWNSDTENFFEDLYFGTNYFWRVRAITITDTSSWSQRTVETRDYVVLDSPPNMMVTAPTTGIDLDWDAHNDVDFYQVQWDTTNLFNSPILESTIKPFINNSDWNWDTEQNTGTLLDNQVYFWRARAINAVDTSNWTSRIFSTGAEILLPAIPNLVSPSNGSSLSVDDVVLDWNSALNATEYQVEYATNSSFIGSTITTNSVTEDALSSLTDGTYYWRVRGKKGGIYSNWSTVWSFTISTCSPSFSSITENQCDEYISPSGKVWLMSGVYTDTLINTTGCDSIITIDLTINTLNTTINFIDGELMAETAGITYQWLNCDEEYTEIIGETNQSFIPSINGTYAVQLNDGTCVDTSACYVVNNLSIDLDAMETEISIYPNPNTGQFMVDLGNKTTSVIIYNALGEVVYKNEFISGVIEVNLSGESGIYTISFIRNDQRRHKKIIVH